MSLPTAAALFALVLGAFFTEAVAGFGATVLTVAFGASLVPLGLLLPSFVPVNLALSLALVARDPAAVDRRVLLRGVLPGMLLGLPLGMLAFRGLAGDGGRWLALGFGLFVTCLAAVDLARLAARSGRAPGPLPRMARVLLLALGGAAHGAWASGGPMVVYVLGRDSLDKTRFRGTLAALWATLGAVLMVGYARGGDLGADSARLSLLLLPAMVLGLVLGERVHRRVPALAFRRAVACLLLFGGLVLIVRHLPA